MSELQDIPLDDLEKEMARRVRVAKRSAGEAFPVAVHVSPAIEGSRTVTLRDDDGTVWQQWAIGPHESLRISGLTTMLRTLPT